MSGPSEATSSDSTGRSLPIQWPATWTAERIGLVACGFVFLHFLATLPNGDVLGNMATSRMVEGRGFFGDLWAWGWMHRPIGYRFTTFLVVRAVEAVVPSYRSVEGMLLGNLLVLAFSLALLWCTSGATKWLRPGRMTLPVPATEVWFALAAVFAVSYGLAQQPCHYAAVFSLGAYYCWRRESLLWHPLGGALFALAFAQKYVSGVYLPVVFVALVLLDGRRFRDLISPVLWALLGGGAVLWLLLAHPYELKDAVTGTLIQRMVWERTVALATRVHGTFAVGPFLPHMIPTTTAALAVLPALFERLTRYERWMLGGAWLATLVPFYMQETGFDYHLTPTLGAALLTLALAVRRSISWTKDCWFRLALIYGLFATAALFSPATERAHTVAGAVLLLSIGVTWLTARANELRLVVTTVVLCTALEWSLHDYVDYTRDTRKFADVDESVEKQKIRGRGLFLGPASTIWLFSDLHSACRHTAAIPLQRLSRAPKETAEKMLADPGVRENLECVERYDGDWIVINQPWFKHRRHLAEYLPRDPLRGYKVAAKLGDIEIWSKHPIKEKKKKGW